VAVSVALLYATVAGTELPDELLSVKLIVLGCTASLNVAVSAEDTDTFVAPLAGDALVTVGAAVESRNNPLRTAFVPPVWVIVMSRFPLTVHSRYSPE
jgi:hypothetical protein